MKKMDLMMLVTIVVFLSYLGLAIHMEQFQNEHLNIFYSEDRIVPLKHQLEQVVDGKIHYQVIYIEEGIMKQKTFVFDPNDYVRPRPGGVVFKTDIDPVIFTFRRCYDATTWNPLITSNCKDEITVFVLDTQVLDYLKTKGANIKPLEDQHPPSILGEKLDKKVLM